MYKSIHRARTTINSFFRERVDFVHFLSYFPQNIFLSFFFLSVGSAGVKTITF